MSRAKAVKRPAAAPAVKGHGKVLFALRQHRERTNSKEATTEELAELAGLPVDQTRQCLQDLERLGGVVRIR